MTPAESNGGHGPSDGGRRYPPHARAHSPLDRLIAWCLDNKLVVVLFLVALVGWGIMVAPFDWRLGTLPRDPVPVDAIPDIGENQQIVFTEWMGRSPQDIEDQITYPLTTALLGIPGVKTIRSYSYFGFSSVYVIFEEDVEFYWSRSRVLEKLASLPAGTLPPGVEPALGPDATALGQVFWYTLEGRDEEGNPTGGWDLNELRSIQDWNVRYALASAGGVSEVASVGGFVQEYQVDVNPEAMRSYGIGLDEVFRAVQSSNIDVGARTIEINRVEYVIRGLGFIEQLEDIEQTVIREVRDVPVRIADLATVTLGPALRRGALDKGGAEVVGGVVVVRYGENPLEAIQNVKARIAEISAGLPRKTLPDGRVSQVTIVPFYDRTGLIHETLDTLNTALADEILVTIIVVVFMLMNLRSSLLISGLLPITVLMVFITMKRFGVDANVVALSGIAIAIGTIVDMGIVVTENIVRHLDNAPPDANRRDVIFEAASEVGGAVLTAVSTTVVSFLPVFTLEAAEGKLFKPLAWTKTFALVASIILALTAVPPFAHLFFRRRTARGTGDQNGGASRRLPWTRLPHVFNWLVIALVTVMLARHWGPLGVGAGALRNIVFVVLLLGSLLLFFFWFQRAYVPMLRWCLDHKGRFLLIPAAIVLFGLVAWRGVDGPSRFLPKAIRNSEPWMALTKVFPGMGEEFMPDLDEGSFLYMPTTMPHASIGEALGVLQLQDRAFNSIPEVDMVVGKLGRADTPLDPAPISMIETVIQYKPEWALDENGHPGKFRYDKKTGEYARDAEGELIPDRRGRPYRNWREHIRSPQDIWDEIVKAGRVPGTTSAPRLQPIAARIVMLQSGMRAPMGVKIKGPDLETIERVGLQIEELLRKNVESIEPSTVVADRIVGKPYLEIDIDRAAIARYGLSIRRVQDVIEVAIGGKPVTTTVEGRERYPVRVRYPRELRSSIEDIQEILVTAPDGTQIPLAEISEIRFVRGPMVIKSEDTSLVGYVIFDKKPGYAAGEVVEDARRLLSVKVRTNVMPLPAGVSYTFTGTYENQVRSLARLRVVLPLALLIIFLIMYFQFRHVPTTMLVFTGIFIAWAGGFIALWLYGQDWFLNVPVFGENLRDVFHIRAFNLSVAVWVGFLALFGIATDDGVIISTYLKQVFASRRPATVAEIREATIEAGARRIRPALMTAATTLLALIPVLTSGGKGADIMVPMAIPSFGGMVVVLVRVLTVPVLYSWMAERGLVRTSSPAA